MSASLSRHCFYFSDPERAGAAYLYAIAAQITFPGSVCQFRADEHYFLWTLRDAGFTKVTFSKVHIVGALLVLFNGLGGANRCAVAALGTNSDTVDAR
jgi:hypothetical protein